MLDGLNDYLEKLLIAKENQRKSALSALQIQINPHFIYNTLASIKWLVLKGDKEKASNTINAFISLLQNTINETSETITVEQEIDNLKNYVFINETRYGDEAGRIHVFISEKYGKLFCEIVDNGAGMDEEQLSKLYSSTTSKHKHFTGIGIKNVDDRIKLLYGSDYGVKINSEVSAGTTISIFLSLID
ncbi:sensor histidine kinase [Clostridium manihotivorum]|uniref:Signal transduction histidine kinase internal region domain-containing protein n=1 Tax=Clostridium manihotivorum TaxID=2320868 RepID=A0A3R5WZK3_9CLOT|nr:histidine kinase [Clostridium manihotivorum]QAA30506.1 hypothetical protein C1I91_01850 [Clostridium manihotivorum]